MLQQLSFWAQSQDAGAEEFLFLTALDCKKDDIIMIMNPERSAL